MLRKIEILGAKVVCDFLKDSYIFDSEAIANGSNSQEFFVTKQNKQAHQANFHSDGALVQKDRILETIAIIQKIYGNDPVDEFDLKSLFELGNVTVEIDEDIEDRDVMLRHGGGIEVHTELEPGNLGFLDRAYMGNGNHRNVRVFAKHKMMPGGKTTIITDRWAAAGGSQNVIQRTVNVTCYGYELKPRAKLAETT